MFKRSTTLTGLTANAFGVIACLMPHATAAPAAPAAVKVQPKVVMQKADFGSIMSASGAIYSIWAYCGAPYPNVIVTMRDPPAAPDQTATVNLTPAYVSKGAGYLSRFEPSTGTEPFNAAAVAVEAGATADEICWGGTYNPGALKMALSSLASENAIEQANPSQWALAKVNTPAIPDPIPPTPPVDPRLLKSPKLPNMHLLPIDRMMIHLKRYERA